MTRGGPGPRPAAAAPRFVAFAAALLLAACANVAPLAPAAPGEAFSGRLALHVEPLGAAPARALSAAFDLRGDPSSGALGLSTPLGSMLAQARWRPGEVVLVTPRGTQRFADLDGLTREVLGESVPIEAWFDWLRGRPWPGAPTASPPAAPGVEQLGWTVDLGRFAAGAVFARRAEPLPVVTVRIQLDGS
ncbi:MAG: lipoprotein insertase outer membrane protein LolB [Caldimonas sp.]